MQLLTIQDPRDNLQKARRKELERFAEAHGVTEIDPRMPAKLMREILRRKGLTNINIPPRPLGSPQHTAEPDAAQPQEVAEVNEVEDLMRQYQQETGQWPTQPAEPEPEAPQHVNGQDLKEKTGKSVDEMTIYELRAECKRRGVPLKRTDKMHEIRAKLNGEVIT